MKKISILLLAFVSAAVLFTACKNEKQESATVVESAKTPAVETLTADGKYVVQTNTVNVAWDASKVGGKHNGTIGLKEGFVSFEEGKVTGGEFIFDMESITVLDQEGEWKEKLEAHLKGYAKGKEDHFFNVAKFPTATYTITGAELIEANNKVDLLIKGDLEMKGISNPVEILTAINQEGDELNFNSGNIILDRTKWGVNYNSKSIFPDITDNFIYDEISLSFAISTKKSL